MFAKIIFTKVIIRSKPLHLSFMAFPFFTKRFLNNLLGFGRDGTVHINANNLMNVEKDLAALNQQDTAILQTIANLPAPVDSPLLPTQAEKDGLDASTTPSTANPYATIADIPPPTPSVPQTLAQTLVAGKVTGGNDIIVSTGDSIYGQTDLFLSEAAGNNYYYVGPNYLFQQWYDGLGLGNTDFLLQGGGTQLFSHTSMDIQCDTGLYGFYEGTAFIGILDFTNLTGNQNYIFQDGSGTLAFLSDIPAALITAIADTSTIDLVNTAGTLTANFINAAGYITGGQVPANETDPVFTAWLAVPPNVSVFTNDAGYLTSTALTAGQIGFGSAGNVLTSGTDLTWDNTNKNFVANGTIALDILNSNNAAWIAQGDAGYWYTGPTSTGLLGHRGFGVDLKTTAKYTMGDAASGSGNSNYIEINDSASTVKITTIAGVGTQMVTADINGILSKQAIPVVTNFATKALDNLAAVAINADLVLGTSDAFALGSITKQWSDLFLAEGGVINWDNGDVTLTQVGNLLTLAGGNLTVSGQITTSGTNGAVNVNDRSTAEVFSLYASSGIFNIYNNNAGDQILIKRNQVTGLMTAGVQVAAPTAGWHLRAGGTGVNTAPLKFNSGSLMTAPEVGAVEFLTDKFYGTITTGAARQTFATLESAAQAFTNDISVPDEAYGVGWNGSLEVPTKNAVYDKVESLSVASGTYTPTRSAEVNMDSNVTMTQAQYMRVGNTVTASGRFTADPTLTASTTSFEITLPIASNFSAASDAAGTAFCGSIVSMGAEIISVAANDTMKIQWKSSDITSQTWAWNATYQII